MESRETIIGILIVHLMLQIPSGCTPAEVTEYYSSLARSLPTANDAGAAFKSANRLYVDHSVSHLDSSS